MASTARSSTKRSRRVKGANTSSRSRRIAVATLASRAGTTRGFISRQGRFAAIGGTAARPFLADIADDRARTQVESSGDQPRHLDVRQRSARPIVTDTALQDA